MKYIFLIILFILPANFSFAEVYKWVDDQGVVHFTDDFSQIPERYRPEIERMEMSKDKVETGTEGEPSPKKKDIYKDRLGRGEEYWKGRVDEWSKKLKILLERVESLRIKYNELTEKINNSKSSVERSNLRRERDEIKNEMDQNKSQIEETKYMLEKKIPEEAEIYKAKPEWVKE